MDKWEYLAVLVNKWGKCIKVAPRGKAATWEFDDDKSVDLVDLLQEIGSDGWDLMAVDTNISYSENARSYVGSLYIFQRPG